MKEKIIQLIKILGIGVNELIMDIEIREFIFNTIEYNSDEDEIYLHIFEDDIDIEVNFDDISEESQHVIYTKLSQLIYN